ncbi:MAG TPA: translation initiation factor IF-2 N-terminal domain-containing protein, partial [Longimicrobium sp.]|nr:translation initiation factor IF-2 N-terminal domain-containing protein [Longimicrobium sp.]
MRVFEVAKELDVPAEALVHLLREMDVPVRSHMSDLAEEHVARLRTVVKRERRLGHAIAAPANAAEAAAGGRRRRKREDLPAPEPAAEEAAPAAAAQTDVSAGAAPEQTKAEADTTASPTADAAEAIEAEAAQAAADRGADLVTRGGQPPKDVTVVVESPGVPAEAAEP